MQFIKNKISKFFIILFVFFLSSCASKKEMIYFQGNQEPTIKFEEFIPKIQAFDQLAINVSAADIKATDPFNQQSSSATEKTYTVDENGFINYPILGAVKVGGLTRSEAENKLKKELSKYITNPGVNINYTNFKISVLGEVQKPGNFSVTNDRITILEAIGMAGDLSVYGVRKNIMVIREQNGKKNTYTVDITSKDVLNSPVYYLAQNDVIYVAPNGAKISSSKFSPNYSLLISVTGIILSVISIISR